MDPKAAALLGGNQLFFMCALVAYGAWNLHVGYQPSPELKGMMGGFEETGQSIHRMMYLGLIVLSVIFQGGNAMYYHSRRSLLESARRETPAWAIELLRD